MRRSITAAAAAACLLLTAAGHGDETVRVTGNTVDESAGENGSTGWWFNRDTSTSSPFEFTFDEASIGYGSLYVEPIGSNPSDKFIAENFAFLPVSEIEAIGYDFLIAGDGTSADANHFYLNVYANIDDSTNFYDCRFDYVPSTGSTSGFTTVSFASSDIPSNVRHGGSRIAACPATLDGMPAGSHVRMFAVSVGDTSTNDEGLAGYLDAVVLDTVDGTTTYDFEVPLTDKDQCKKGGYERFGFDNQGRCISSLQANGKAGK